MFAKILKGTVNKMSETKEINNIEEQEIKKRQQSEEKKKALDSVFQVIEKQYGKGSIMML